MYLDRLESFLKKTAIPIVNIKPLTFLGISKQPHYENVWSNIYSFFFNYTAEHKFDDLFIRSLALLISRRGKEKFYLSMPFDIETEYRTPKNGRIDLLLSNPFEAIIIENKVYHSLKNDLQDYWDSVPQKKKRGVILSLKRIPKNEINNSNYINITHFELLQCVIENISSYFTNANEKYIIFLKDFYQNVINITNPMDDNVIIFYCKNQDNINKIKDINDSFVNYIISEVEKARNYVDEKLEPYNNHGRNFRYYLCPNQSNLMITIVFENLFNKKKELLIIIELQNDLLDQKEKIKKIVFNSFETPLLRSDFYNKKGTWAHFAILQLEVEDHKMLNLSSHIADSINNSPILHIYRKLKTALVDEK